MSWPRAFLPVPTHWLEVERQDVARSPKADPHQLQHWMNAVPELYQLQARGLTDSDFRRFVEAPRDEHERQLGDTYRHLFSTSPSAEPLRADFVDGRGLVVQAGQHRVLAAQAAGVPVLPAHVAAPDQYHLDRIRDACEAETRSLGPEYQSAPELHRRHDDHFYRDAPARSPERHIGPERLEPEREDGWFRPERER